jgi:hypothetical protein
MPFQPPIQRCRDVIIGHSLQALLYSYLNNIPIIINKKPSHVLFDFCNPDLPLHLVGLRNNTTTLKTNEGSVRFGASKVEIMADIMLCITTSGLLLNSVPPWNINVKDRKIDYFTKAKKYSVSYETARIFDSNNITGLNIRKHNMAYEVYDNIHIRSSNKSDVEYIKTEDDFVKEIYIHPSNRNGTRKDDRDIICKSVLTKEQLNSFDYSDTICRMKVASKMKENGFMGSRAGLSKKDPLKHYHRELALVSAERIVHEKYTLKCEEHNSNIVIDNSTLRQVIDQRPSVASRASQINNTLRNEEVL